MKSIFWCLWSMNPVDALGKVALAATFDWSWDLTNVSLA